MTTNLGADTGAGTAAQRKPVALVRFSMRTTSRILGFSRLAWMLTAVLLVGACSSAEDIAAAEGQISHFRQMMAAQQFGRIYADAGEELRKATTEQEMVSLLAAVDRKLGTVKSAEKNGWNLNYQTSGTFVTLKYKTQFERGSGVETFVYRMADRRALLTGYHINSNQLIAN